MLEQFHRLTGAIPAVEPWALGTFMSRCVYEDAAMVSEVIGRLDDIAFPFDVVHLDPAWQRCSRGNWKPATDWEWDAEMWGEPISFFEMMRERGLRVSLWENPYALVDSQTFHDLNKIGGLAVSHGDGKPMKSLWNGEGAVVDFTLEAARQLWREWHLDLLSAGVSLFKTDFGEGVPEGAEFSDGRTGSQLHNLYPLLYNRTVFDATREGGIEHPIVFGRSGWLGSHRYPLQWSGDSKCTWADMRGALRAGLSAVLSGTGYWSVDIGGFYADDPGRPDDELYARWAWLGLLLPVARFHGVGPREPYEYGDEACAAVLTAARLRYSLLPYMVRHMPRGRASDISLLRPLLLGWSQDRRCADEDTEFLLGPDLLVAPVMEPGGQRTVYLLEGEWGDWWSGEVLFGPCEFQVDVPLHRVPLYQRGASRIELGSGRRVADVLTGPLRSKAAEVGYESLQED
ncbi:MAG: TIM-barrel domain-containing protein [Candidatus Dormibacteria bacterium]